MAVIYLFQEILILLIVYILLFQLMFHFSEPLPPRDVRIADLEATAITLEWDQPDGSGWQWALFFKIITPKITL